jgi:hypothetical protein
MKAKTLLIAAATLAVGAITSQAQVYSQNIVGYINVQLTNGFNLVANQLDLDGTGTNNTVQTFMGTNFPVNTTKVLAWDPISQGYKSITLLASGWGSGTAGPFVKAGLQPGKGVFIQVASATNFTMVGQVLSPGTNYTVYPSQYQLASFQWPVAGFLTTNLNYAPNSPNPNFDKVLTWSAASQSFTTHSKLAGSWQAGSPNIAVAQSFFLLPNQSTTWTNYFVTPQ